MSKLISASIDATKVTKAKMKDGKYIQVTIELKDEPDQYGNNVSIYENQSKEEREAKEKRVYIGNGRVVWESDEPRAKKQRPAPQIVEDEPELPF